VSLSLYAHPFSSYSQKALIAFYENDIPFTYRSMEEPEANAELQALWPRKSFPVLVDDGKTVVEATSIIEHLAVHHPGPVALIPADPAAAVEVRMLDRIFDHHVMETMQQVVFDALKPEQRRDPDQVQQAKERLEATYGWLDRWLEGRTWASGESYSLADAAASPSLFYADWTHPTPERFANLRAYRARLLQRPSFARCVEEGRPYRAYFPLGAPDRD